MQKLFFLTVAVAATALATYLVAVGQDVYVTPAFAAILWVAVYFLSLKDWIVHAKKRSDAHHVRFRFFREEFALSRFWLSAIIGGIGVGIFNHAYAVMENHPADMIVGALGIAIMALGFWVYLPWYDAGKNGVVTLKSAR